MNYTELEFDVTKVSWVSEEGSHHEAIQSPAFNLMNYMFGESEVVVNDLLYDKVMQEVLDNRERDH